MRKRILLLAVPLFFLLAPTLFILWSDPHTLWLGVSFLCGAGAGIVFVLGAILLLRTGDSPEADDLPPAVAGSPFVVTRVPSRVPRLKS